MDRSSEAWWRHGIFYQVYPRSFQDSDTDGVGDLKGIIEWLPYLQSLGIDAVWLSPTFPSPMADFGYDISDYTGIDPLFGTMAEFRRADRGGACAGAKADPRSRAEHTSDRHPWFIESRSSRDNPKRDWYIWRDGDPDGGPPNNWLSNSAATPGSTTRDRSILLSRLSEGAAGPQLAQSGGARGDP